MGQDLINRKSKKSIGKSKGMTKSKTKDMTKCKSKGDFRLGSGVRTRLMVLIRVRT